MKKLYLLLLSFYICNTVVARVIPGFLYYNSLQYNAAYAGQDSLSINGTVYSNMQHFKAKDTRVDGLPVIYQFSIANNIAGTRSAVGLFLSDYAVGLDDYSSKEYVVGGIYNYNFKLDEIASLRLGLQANLNIIKQATFDTKTNATFDPAIWYKRNGINFGLSVKNALGNKSYSTDYIITTYYETALSTDVKFIPGFNFLLSHFNNSFSGSTITEINPQVNFEFVQALLFNAGWSQQSYAGNNSHYFTIGTGAQFSSHTKLLLSYKGAKDELNDYLSVMLKLNL